MSSDATDWVGIRLAGGRYQVTAKLGEGGMGLVYRARDKNLDSDVVIKVPRQGALADADFSARFGREIRSLVKLAHPHVVRISDVGQHDGRPFAVMQFLPGGSLKERQPKDPKGLPLPVTPNQLLDWVEVVSEALDFIHQQGFVHRDVKPANILFDAHGNPFLSDFGIAKVLADNNQPARSSSLTGTGLVLGTPEYMAPELIMGERFDGRSDQYSLAVTVHEMLAGRLPFDGPTPSAILVRHTRERPPSLHELDPSIAEVLSFAVLRGLAKQPQKRFPDCRTFAASVTAPLRSSAPVRAGPRVATREIVAAPDALVSQGPAVSLSCPFCRQFSRIPVELAGKLVRCSKCNKRLVVSDDLMQLRYAFDDDRARPSAETDPQAVEQPERSLNSRGTARLSRAIGDTLSYARVHPAVPRHPKPRFSPGAVWIVLALAAFLALAGGGLWFHHHRQSSDTAKLNPPMPNSRSPVATAAPAADRASRSTATRSNPKSGSDSGTTEVSTASTPGLRVSDSTVKSVGEFKELSPSNTPGIPSGALQPPPATPSDRSQLLQRFALSAPPTGVGKELAVCREIAQLAYANLAMAALAAHKDDVYREAVQSVDKVSDGRVWEEVDSLFDEYARAMRQLVGLLGGQVGIAGGSKVQDHLLVSETYGTTLIGFYRGRLGGSDSIEARELAEEIRTIEEVAELEKLAAMTSLQAICQVHLNICRTLAAVATFGKRTSSTDARRLVEQALEQDYSDGLEQLRYLLACELRLWSNVAEADVLNR